MNVFLTGANGYIGGSVAVRLMADGHRIRGLVRSPQAAGAVRAIAIEPVTGTLADTALLAREAQRADAVVNAADSDDRAAVEAMLAALAGSGKPFIHTSGSSVVADDARGAASVAVFDDSIHDAGSDWTPTADKKARADLDRAILAGASQGVRAVVICPPLIYGHGLGPERDSRQLPTLVAQARASGIARHAGPGRNVWSNVHIEDLVDLYALALAKAAPGTFLFAENGEAAFRDLTAAIARALRLGPAQDWPIDEAVAAWGRGRTLYAQASNSRIRATHARALGWTPRHGSILAWIERNVAPSP
ncbi:MAG: NAD-dependent epimerase/dehydratase family protein [Alphaproteobacteria bacterium]|nr:NAD-dependent epimerase/dehydratase family protein [Alphaproteobacteria bacterium]